MQAYLDFQDAIFLDVLVFLKCFHKPLNNLNLLSLMSTKQHLWNALRLGDQTSEYGFDAMLDFSEFVFSISIIIREMTYLLRHI